MDINQFQQQFNLRLLSEGAIDLFISMPGLDELPEIDRVLTREENLQRTKIYQNHIGPWLLQLHEYIKVNQHSIDEIRTCIALFEVFVKNEDEVNTADAEACAQWGLKPVNKGSAEALEIVTLLSRLVSRLNNSEENAQNIQTYGPLSMHSGLDSAVRASQPPVETLVSHLDKLSIFSMSRVSTGWNNSISRIAKIPTRKELCIEESMGAVYPHGRQQALLNLTEDLNDEEFVAILQACRERRGFLNSLSNNLSPVFQRLKEVPFSDRLEYLNKLPKGESEDLNNMPFDAEEYRECVEQGYYKTISPQQTEFYEGLLPLIYALRILIPILNARGVYAVDADRDCWAHNDELITEMAARHMSEEGLLNGRYLNESDVLFDPARPGECIHFYADAIAANFRERLTTRVLADRARLSENAGLIDEADDNDEKYTRAVSTTQIRSTGKRKDRISDDQSEDADLIDETDDNDEKYNRAASTTQVRSTGKRKDRISEAQEEEIDADLDNYEERFHADDDNSNVNDSDNKSVNDDDNDDDDVDNLHPNKRGRF